VISVSILKKVNSGILLTSILTGALLFFSPFIRAESLEWQPDSLPKARTQTHLPGEHKPRTLSRMIHLPPMDSIRIDSVRKSPPDSVQTPQPDSVQLRGTDSTAYTSTHIQSHVGDTVSLTDRISLSDEPVTSDRLETAKQEKKFTPSPQRATILSAVFPGLGQAYNRRYWKIPIIYAGGAALYYGYYRKNEEFLTAKREFNKGVAEGLTINNQDLKKYQSERDDARSKRDYFVIYMGILYVANVVDAMTDAYFRQYDMSDNLEMVLKPAVMPTEHFAGLDFSYGVKLSLKF